MNSSTHKVSGERVLPPLWLIVLGVLTLFFWLVHELRELVTLLVVGYFLAYATEPIIRWLEMKRVKRPLGLAVLWGGLFAIGTILTLTAVPTVVREVNSLSTNFSAYIEKALKLVEPVIEQAQSLIPDNLTRNESKTNGLAVQPELKSQPDPQATDAGESTVGPQTDQATSGARIPYLDNETLKGIASGVGTALWSGYSVTLTLLNFLLLPFIIFYISVDFASLHRSALRLVPKRYRDKTGQMIAEIDGYVSRFIRGQIVVCSILFVLYAIGLASVGVELWLLLAIISGFGNLVPYLGFLVGIVLSSLMAVATFGDWPHVLWVWVVFAVVQFFEGMIITPRVLGSRVGLSPLTVILAIVIGGTLFGLLGIFLAVPGAAAMKVLATHAHAWLVEKIEAD